MCTIIILYRIIPSYPVVVAGNRDEFLVRPSLRPHLWEAATDGNKIKILSGRDVEAGGTWFGVNQYGVVAGVTNRPAGKKDTSKCSRGRVVLQCLCERSPDHAQEFLLAEVASQYNPFNLFCLNPQSGFLFTNFPNPSIRSHIGPGIHLLTNQAMGDPDDTKASWIREQLRDLPIDSEELVTRLMQILRHHGKEDTPVPLCVHLTGYATVSSYLLLLEESLQGSGSRFLFREGSPCMGDYEDLSDELRRLFKSGKQ